VKADGDCSPNEPAAYRFGCDDYWYGSYSDAQVGATTILHGNYDYITDGVANWDSTDHDLKASIYYDSKPDWWCSETSWPAIGPDVIGKIDDIPSQRRYDGATCSVGAGCGSLADCADQECKTKDCVSGDCVYSPDIGASCDDSIDCTVDSCDANGCYGTPDDSYCDNIIPAGCTVAVCDNSRGCQFSGCQTNNFQPEQIIEAEDGDISGLSIGSDSGASGDYVYLSSGSGSVSFTFDISVADEYYMEARVNTNDDRGQDSFFVGLDNEPVNGDDYYAYDLVQTGSFVWDDVNRRGSVPIEFDPMVWDLSVGEHTFTFYGREVNAWFDQLILSMVRNPADTDNSGCVELHELFDYIDEWKAGNVVISDLMVAISIWKSC